MTAFASLLPTHAMFAEAASSNLGVLASSREPLPDPIRKYVIVINPYTNSEQAIVFAKDITHRDVVPSGFTPVSAGFLMLYPTGVQVLEKFESESLHLQPRPQDVALLTEFLS